jgi:hypothetical protein
MREDQPFLNKLKWYYCYWIWEVFVPLQFTLVQFLIPLIGQEYRWITAIVFPILKKFNDYVMEGLSCKASESKAKGIMKMQLEVVYNISVVGLISSSTDYRTNYLILVGDFAMDLISTLQLITLHRKINPTDVEMVAARKKKKEMVTELIISELLDCLVPLIYIITFTLAYHGPNAENLGGVKNDYWQFQEVNVLMDYLTPAAQMAFINLVGGMISVSSLYEFCNINLLKESNDVIAKYGRITAVFIVLLFIKVR